MNTSEKVKQIIAEYKDIAIEQVTDEASLLGDLGLDSLDTVELIMSMEDEFGVTLEAGQGLKTVADVVKFIDEAVANA